MLKLHKEMSGFRLNIASKNTKRRRGVISFGCPFLFLQINYAFQIHGAQPLFKIKSALYICWKTFCSFFFVQFHCVGWANTQGSHLLLKMEVVLYICSEKSGTKMFFWKINGLFFMEKIHYSKCFSKLQNNSSGAKGKSLSFETNLVLCLDRN